ncbi:MAG: T9SS type A sorting domain-containing protein, partial [Bacteroidales bacterium]|nr:T9SS type A sorting domain-containing protein [Bacteroidales bacterium]
HTLTPGGNNFNLAQEIIINAYPDTSLYTYPQKLITGTQTLTSESGSFEDGSGRLENYANHMDYTWIIQPDLDSIQKIDFYIQYEIAENDTLFISSNDPVMDEYRITNDSGSLELTVLKNQILLRLVSGSTETKDGFYAYYSTTIPSYCAPLQIITAKSGKISDGSGSKRYNNFTECKKRIKIDNVNYISLHFTKFETEKDKDILYIYDYASANNDLLLSLSGNIGDTTFVLNTNFLFMVFVTDEQNTYDGWELSYTSGVSAIDELKARSHSLYVFPNPATDQVYIEHLQDIIKEMYVYNLLGKQVKYFNVNNTKTTLSISDLSKGIYFLHIQTDKGIETKKIVKE